VRLAERRIGLLFAVFLALLGIAAVRAVWIGTVRAGSLKERAVTQQEEDLTVNARRGTIFDRNGLELAVSEDATTVFANPFLIKNPGKVAAKLAPLMNMPEDDLLRMLSDRSRGFVYLRRKMDSWNGHKVARLDIPGIDTVTEPKRSYPQGWLGAQVLGNVGLDNYGLSGLEYSRDEELRGEDGRRRLVKDALGEPVSMVEVKRSSPGTDLHLTVDARIQARTEEVLGEVGSTWRPKGATALVLDPRTGAVLALANWPRVDANDPGESPAWARRDRSVGVSYEPGSTFKAFTVAGALQERLIDPNTPFNLAPQIHVADRVVGEAHDRGRVTLTTSDILAQSSNVGAVTIGLKLGARHFDRWVHRFGFGRPTGIELPGEQQGIVPRYADYSGSSIGNLPIGQGLAVTPMQMARAYTAIANHGVMRSPYILAGDRRPGRRVLSGDTADKVSKMLEGVLGPGGTAQEAQVEGYELAGKTGTAEKPDGKGGYSKTKFVASFIGYAPARDPRLLVAVMVDEPQGDIYGGTVAAPAFESIAEFALPYLRIPPG
jgi:cell division protein FtsI (penicillin-binding protein 3)